MEAMDTYDVVLVGSGTTGQTAAFYLKEKGVSVALLKNQTGQGAPVYLPDASPKNGLFKADKGISGRANVLINADQTIEWVSPNIS